MADNVSLTAGDGTIVAGADVIGGVAYPRAKVVWGPDNTVNDTDVASGKPLPVQLRTATGTATPLPALGTAGSASSDVITVQGVASMTKLLVTPDLPSGASTAAKQPALGTAGSASTDVITIQGIASGTVVPISSTALGTTAITRGAGASDSGTVRVTVDSGQLATLGSAASSASQPIVIASDQKFFANAYETVAASQTAQVLGGSGATGDYISHLLVIPATTSPGNVLLLDNATSITVFTGGSSSVTTLHPFTIDLRMVSASGAWKVTTGSNVSVIGVGKFT
jgi:hypothetical protein